MDRVFVYEHVTATTPHPDPADSLYREGRAMRDAVVRDFQSLPGVDTVPWRAGRRQPPVESPAAGQFHGGLTPPRSPRKIDPDDDFDALVRTCDAALIIAPETDGVLESLVRRVEACGVPLLGPGSDAVRLTADKLALYHLWKAAGVPTPESTLLPDLPSGHGPFVVKPRDGCGSAGVSFHPSFPRLAECGMGNLVQTFVPGVAVSVAFVIGPHGTVPLVPAFQCLSTPSDFRYIGGELPIPPTLSDRAVDLGRRAVACVPGLSGYVGVDLVLGEGREGGADDYAIEINPRFTTSYVGLRVLCEINLAGLLLDVGMGRPAGLFGWKPGRVRFYPDGTANYAGT